MNLKDRAAKPKIDRRVKQNSPALTDGVSFEQQKKIDTRKMSFGALGKSTVQ